jgi:hypothetical protein
MPVLCDRPDVIVLTDEAHRSQYDTLALSAGAGQESGGRRRNSPAKPCVGMPRCPLGVSQEAVRQPLPSSRSTVRVISFMVG